MNTYLATYLTPAIVLVSSCVIVAIVIGWVLVRSTLSNTKRILLLGSGLLAIVGCAAIVTCVLFRTNPSFADTFRIYGYTKLAPAGDPFTFSEGEFHPTLTMRDVVKINGEVRFGTHPNPDYPTLVALFAPGKYIEADMIDNVLTIPATPDGSLPRVINTSLWWAFTKNIRNVVSE